MPALTDLLQNLLGRHIYGACLRCKITFQLSWCKVRCQTFHATLSVTCHGRRVATGVANSHATSTCAETLGILLSGTPSMPSIVAASSPAPALLQVLTNSCN